MDGNRVLSPGGSRFLPWCDVARMVVGMSRTRPIVLCLLALLAFVASGCGESPKKGVRNADVLLDWTPNPAHAGILTALSWKLDRANGVNVKLRVPSSSADGVRLLVSKRADFAVLDIHDLALAQAQGQKLTAVMAIVGRPLAALISRTAARPRELVGRTVGVTGAPSDVAVTRAIVAGDGGNPDKVKRRNAGFGAIEALLGGRVDGSVGFANQEGVALERLGRGYKTFPLDSYGAPAYPELVLVTLPQTIKNDRALITSVVTAFTEGTRAATADPGDAITAVKHRVAATKPGLLEAQTRSAVSRLLPPNGIPGSLDMNLLKRWATWEVASGIVKTTPNVSALFDPSFGRKG